jgi:hypothetical protein
LSRPSAGLFFGSRPRVDADKKIAAMQAISDTLKNPDAPAVRREAEDDGGTMSASDSIKGGWGSNG